ncbi:MAG: hypothetical protein LBR28_01285 [Bacteroidales bacterium]|nr:hypothetical protein [Bacteroidales bacterium]
MSFEKTFFRPETKVFKTLKMIALAETMVAAVETMIRKTETKVVGFATMVAAVATMVDETEMWVYDFVTNVTLWIASLSLAMTGEGKAMTKKTAAETRIGEMGTRGDAEETLQEEIVT